MEDNSVPTIVVGVDDSDRSLDAVPLTRRLAVASGAAVLVAAAFPYDDEPSPVSNRELRRELELDSAIRGIAAGIRAEAVLLDGDPPQVVAEETDRLDLLVTGSRRYGPLHAVLARGFPGRLLHEVACPVIVVPRGVDAPLRSLFVQEASRQ
jgi:nucleotide-binding universal stress UspA family protein